MAEFRWVLHDVSGGDVRTTEGFGSKEEAEAWMGAEWAALREEGADSVSLLQDDEILYRMSLKEA